MDERYGMEDAVEIISGNGAASVILLCDHASNNLPEQYGSLGLPTSELERHIGYDIGAAGVTRAMAAALSCPAALSRFSRLLIDPNRGEDDPTLIMKISDGALIPVNVAITAAEAINRVTHYYAPYHSAVAQLVENAMHGGYMPIIVSLHSFTPEWRGAKRPWHAGVLWDGDPRLALPLIDALREDGSLIVGDNEPYSGALKGDTLYKHATLRGLAHALVEIRQDLIADAAGQQAWAGRLVQIIRRMMADPALAAQLASVQHFPSRADQPRTHISS
ncbi:MAG: N-formylglutamate amidohydrolase [Chitinophagales bacterium]|nr:N-formylglutamate amidohydrolase [Hyphomicrobiales bacterium]